MPNNSLVYDDFPWLFHSCLFGWISMDVLFRFFQCDSIRFECLQEFVDFAIWRCLDVAFDLLDARFQATLRQNLRGEEKLDSLVIIRPTSWCVFYPCQINVCAGVIRSIQLLFDGPFSGAGLQDHTIFEMNDLSGDPLHTSVQQQSAGRNWRI